jgi:ABC-type uncharacterized transport system permease subunit
MPPLMTTTSLVLLTLLSATASVLALRRLFGRATAEATSDLLQHLLVAAVTVGAMLVFLYQAMVVHEQWRPLEAHVDGLLLIAALLGATVWFLQVRPHLAGMSAFALPVLTLILAWGVCASAWTYRPFELDTLSPVWKTLHLTGVYLGTLCSAIAATAGAMFLFVERRLRQKQALRELGRMASLETLERLIVRAATLGFALLTLGLIAGLVLHPQESSLGPGWWHSPKVLLATAAWLIYAVVMNVRYATHFRGSRAAWLSIAGFLLLLLTYGVVTAVSDAMPARSGIVHAAIPNATLTEALP